MNFIDQIQEVIVNTRVVSMEDLVDLEIVALERQLKDIDTLKESQVWSEWSLGVINSEAFKLSKRLNDLHEN